METGYIALILKSGDCAAASNYWPIVILSTLSIVFESLVLEGLEFELKHMFIPQQHGFHSGRSTATNLIIFQPLFEFVDLYYDFMFSDDFLFFLILLLKKLCKASLD